jgi:hypothetical protein
MGDDVILDTIGFFCCMLSSSFSRRFSDKRSRCYTIQQ